MKPEIWAILTALCWGVGSFFEKKGVKLGGLSPVMGTAVRTVVSMVILGAVSYPCWSELKGASTRSLLMIAIGGGVVAGCIGLICLYKGLFSGDLSRVMVIAFCLTPVVGAIMGTLFMGDVLGWRGWLGVTMTIAGAALVTFSKHSAAA